MNFTKRGILKLLKKMKSKSNKLMNTIKVSILELALAGIICGCILGACVGIGAFNGIIASAPELNVRDVIPKGYATVVYDIEGHEMTKLVAANSNRTYVTIDKVPQDLCNAFVAIEDSRFYSHNGIDIKGIVRAGYEGIKSGGHFSQGASTITQQLLKNNVFDDSWVTETNFMNKVKRKIQEQYLAVELEKQLDKSEILELYMNTVNLGQNTLGVQAASQRYFGKPVYQLTLSECAVIAGITQNPSKWNPISHPDKSAERREKVLGDMKKNGFITAEEYNTAMADDVYSRIQKVNETVETNSINSYFVDELTDQVINDLINECGYDSDTAYWMLYSNGLKIYSTQDPEVQRCCDEVFGNEENYEGTPKYLLNYRLSIEKPDGSVKNFSNENYQTYFKEFNSKFSGIYNTEEDAAAAIEEYKAAVMESGDEVLAEVSTLTLQPQASITVMDQSKGYVVAMVGGRGTKIASKTLNRASDSMRQPGSLFKVLSTYAPALDACGFTLGNVQNDAKFTYTNGRPISNWYGETYRGVCTLRTGIAQSLNIVTVKVLTQITPQMGYNYLQNFGFTTLVDKEVTADGQIMTDVNQALALGGITHGVTNMETTAAFATIANEGVYIKPTLYTKITDSDGNVIIDKTQTNETHRVLKETTAFLLTSAMREVVTSGTGTMVNFGNMAIAGKTGTTSDYNDIWFSGFTPYYTATVWVGFDNNDKLANNQHNTAKILWKETMSRIHAELPYEDFSMPNGITTCTICTQSGKLPNPGLCDECLRTEYYEVGTTPTESCDVHYMGTICGYDGKIACENCPFKTEGVALLPLQESSVLDYGQMDGVTDNHCCHNSDFFLQPNYPDIISGQMYEMMTR